MHPILIEIDSMTNRKVGELLHIFCGQEFEFNLNEMDTRSYSILFDFSEGIIARLSSRSEEGEKFLVPAFGFINTLSEATNLEVANLLRVGIFEILLDTRRLDDQIMVRLSDKAKILYLKHKEEYF